MNYFYACVDVESPLLGVFLRHYSEFPIERRLIVINTPTRFHRKLKRAIRLVKDSGAILADVWIEKDWNAAQHRVRQSVVSAYCQPSDWVITADVDEFHQYQVPVTQITRQCDERGYDYVRGHVVDRVSASGDFPKLDPTRLWEQFPVECKLTENILEGCCEKVALSRAWVELNLGQHFAISQKATACPIRENLVKVHHFKWHEGVVERSKRRAVELARGGYYWANEPEKFLAFIADNDQKLNLQDERLDTRLSAPSPLSPSHKCT